MKCTISNIDNQSLSSIANFISIVSASHISMLNDIIEFNASQSCIQALIDLLLKDLIRCDISYRHV